MLKKLLLPLVAALLGVAGANAQPVQQSGSITPGHAVRWITNGVIADGGTAASGSLTSLGVTNNGGPGICVNSAAITGPYNQICLSATTNGGGKISSYIYGGATSPGFVFDINGSLQGVPVVTLPVSNNDLACFDGTTGTIKDCGFTFNFGPQVANTFLAGPTSGPSANPSFRAIVPGDLTLNGLHVALRTTGGNTYYASPTGINLNNSCLVLASPCTPQGALDQAQYFNDAQGGSPSIQLLDGTYHVPDSAIFMLASGAAIGVDKFAVVGNCSTPANVIVALGNNSIGISAQDLGILANISCITIQADVAKTGGAGLYAYQHGVIDVGPNMHFGGIPGGNHMLLDFDGKINVVSPYIIDPGTTANHINVTNTSRISLGGASAACNGVTPPTFTNFIVIGPGASAISPGTPTVYSCGGTTVTTPYFINGGTDYSQISWPNSANGNYQRFFQATLSGNQTGIADATFTKLAFVGNSASSSWFSGGTWSPHRGISDLTCSARWNDAADTDYMVISIFKNGSEFATTGDPVAASGTSATKIVSVKDASVLNDTYDCRVFLQHGSGTHTVTAGASTIFSGVLLGD